MTRRQTRKGVSAWSGRPYPLGSAYDGEGTNFALFSEVAERVEHLVLHVAPHAGRPEVVVVRLADGRHRHVVRGQRGLEVPAEREPLQRVVGHAVMVEVAAEPAPPAPRVHLAHLPVVP